MIYIENSNLIPLLKYFSKFKKFEIIIWLYQDYKKKDFCDIPITKNKEYESITSYSDGTVPIPTKKVFLNKKIIKIIKENQDLINEHCDSISLYRKDDKKWYFSLIGHENSMTLIRDDLIILNTLV